MMLPLIILSGILFIQVGVLIGLALNSAKTGTALSSVCMVSLFLVGTIYQALPKWKDLLVLIPSVSVVENLPLIYGKAYLVHRFFSLKLFRNSLYFNHLKPSNFSIYPLIIFTMSLKILSSN